ncbi:MAG: hypothetical protein ABIH09_00290 [Candidatus Omnitrophota bacterium]
MNKPENYDNTKAAQGYGVRPDPGGYVLQIVDVVDKKTKTEKRMLEISLDIADGRFNGWCDECTKKYGYDSYFKLRQIYEGKSLQYFKKFIEDVEWSNKGYKFDFDENTLKGKLVGGCLREEEYIGKNGETKTSLKLWYTCPVTDVAKIKTPDILSLNRTDTMNENTKNDLPF